MTAMKRSPARRAAIGLLLCISAALAACAVQTPGPTTAVRPGTVRSCLLVGEPCPTNFQFVQGLNGPARSVAAGGHGVWALDDQGAVYRFDVGAGAFVQVPGSLAWLSVGGGNVVVPDEVWGGTADYQHLFRWNGSWQEMQSPINDPIGFVAAGPGHNLNGCHLTEVWGLSLNGHPFRRNSCIGEWEPVLAPGPAQALTAISTGGGEVWGLDAQTNVYRFDGAAFQPVTGHLTSLAVGVDGVWGILGHPIVATTSGTLARIGPGNLLFTPQVFQYDPASKSLVQVPNAVMAQISAGGSGVWAVDQGLSVWRLQAVARKFAPLTNIALRSLSVGSGTGVWGIDQNYRIRAFVTPSILVGGGNAGYH
jgi:hypothetical protein